MNNNICTCSNEIENRVAKIEFSNAGHIFNMITLRGAIQDRENETKTLTERVDNIEKTQTAIYEFMEKLEKRITILEFNQRGVGGPAFEKIYQENIENECYDKNYFK